MLDNYKILTVTHKRVNLHSISDFVVKTSDPSALKMRLQDLKEQFGLDELLYLSTCNRVMYFFHTDRQLDLVFAVEFFKQVNPQIEDDILATLDDSVQILEGMDALEHYFTVSASMDSMVIGERQILGQLRDAYDQCKDWNLIGDNLRMAMDQAVAVAKSIYSNTRIGDKPVSIASLAIQKMMRHHLPKDARILIIGAGQTNALVAKFLDKHHFTQVSVFNRTVSKAEEIAAIFPQGRAYDLDALQQYQEGFDALIVCTAATEPVITPALYPQLLNGETGSKVLIDLSIPHNISPKVIANFDNHYIEIEGLRALAKENLAFREQEVKKAKVMLAEFIEELPKVFQQRRLEIAMRQVPVEIKAVKDRALNEVFHKEVAQLDTNTRALVERMLEYMEKKCIGIPMKAAKEVIF
ncbi:glutamyl-tRNA reductase [Haliscomenobacter hydrossis]|uniref:Glutamyl-tRNA reductase n=1 Tax=Haliscomenobacter hydrossis (strain ATCC 27775 / DSM 1100 / LMG 10767 / O) TaxID=760192 RepID=F4L215_HALH1|nr:glutamyl-tRNA reductase [Haliscomenobacter hydrossis]AEE50648.1 Glutamyl-tRNA reductase [Haliscomenobacter hydrossis DSM 1100]